MELTYEQLQARVRELELEKAKGKGTQSVSFKVGEKGGVSVYGLGRFPVTLYRSQWDKLFSQATAIQEFMTANQHLLAEKPSKDAAAKA
jgi:hypothetical protein